MVGLPGWIVLQELRRLWLRRSAKIKTPEKLLQKLSAEAGAEAKPVNARH